jgi:hypothetical protein
MENLGRFLSPIRDSTLAINQVFRLGVHLGQDCREIGIVAHRGHSLIAKTNVRKRPGQQVLSDFQRATGTKESGEVGIGCFGG